MAKHGLGRGLNALIKETPAAEAETDARDSREHVPVDNILPNPYQPRQNFAPEELAELAVSIKAHGVLQPVLVRRKGAQFELVTGERRWRAARQIGLAVIPAIVKEVGESEMLELGLIENLQRENLNVIEEAEGYQNLAVKFNLSQDEIAKRVGKARATVANVLRILTLPQEIRRMLAENKLQTGHAKALLAVPLDEEKCLLARRAAAEGWPVRAIEKAAARLTRAPRKKRTSRDDIPAQHLQHISDLLHRHFGTGIRIFPCRTLANGKKTRGALEIDFYSSEDLNRILELLGLGEERST
ncbi:MAG: ParB/RepB/Spo0J family partition protein [Kiritimatiellae bacterium]|jgi:ParB family chromosome partitioning protein|nr:ParB/RepB/Spo0J family partition protein [Kiritimatiellia bacterium]